MQEAGSAVCVVRSPPGDPGVHQAWLCSLVVWMRKGMWRKNFPAVTQTLRQSWRFESPFPGGVDTVGLLSLRLPAALGEGADGS